MSVPDIRDLITFPTQAAQAATEPIEPKAEESPAIKVTAPDSEQTLQDEGSTLEKQDEQTEGDAQATESKSKEDRKKEGRKIERKIGDLYRDNHKLRSELERVTAQLAERSAKNSEIDLDSLDFDSRVKHVAKNQAVEELLNLQKAELEAKAAQSSSEIWAAKVAEVAETLKDFDDVVSKANVPIDRAAMELIMASDVGPQLAYEIAKHPEIAQRIKPDASAAVIAKEILKLEMQIESRVSTPIQATQAPRVNATPSPNSPSNTPTKKPWEIPMADFMAQRTKNLGRR